MRFVLFALSGFGDCLSVSSVVVAYLKLVAINCGSLREMGGFKRKREDTMYPGIAFTVGNLARTQQATSCLIEAIQPLLLSEETPQGDNETSLSDLLRSELGELRATKRTMQSGGDLCKGVAYVKILTTTGKRPSELVYELLSNDKNKLPAYISRLMPFDFVTSPHVRNATEVIIARVKPFFEAIAEPTMWNMRFSKHSNSSVDQRKLLDVLIEQIPDRHEPSAMAADWTILIDVTPVMCGMSIVKDFEKLGDYNINKLAKQRELDLDQD